MIAKIKRPSDSAGSKKADDSSRSPPSTRRPYNEATDASRDEGFVVGRPFLVGIGGTTRENSGTERALFDVLNAAEALGAKTQAFGSVDLMGLGHYSPGNLQASGIRLLDAVRVCDGLIIASLCYHGSVSGLVKNALDHLEELRTAERPYLEGRPVGCIVIADGVQAVGTTLSSLRSIVHALRGWPTPFGLAMDSRALQAEPSDRSERESQGVRLLATEVVRFATMQISMRSARLESTAAE